MRIQVDWDRCSGNGMCEAEAPEYFEVQDDGSLELLREEVADEDREKVEAAVASCPTEALSLSDG